MGVLLPKIPRGRQQQQQRDAIDFEMMRAANNGSYVEARRLLVEADRAQKVALHRHVEATLREGQKPKEVETIVRLSTTTGGPSLCNVQGKLTQKRSIPPPPAKESHRPAEARLAAVKRNEEDRDARTRFLVVQEKRVNDAFKYPVNREMRYILAFIQSENR